MKTLGSTFRYRAFALVRVGSYLVAIMLFCANYWINRYFGTPDIDQISYHLQFGAQGLGSSDPAMVRRFVRWCVLAPLLLLAAVLVAERRALRWAFLRRHRPVPLLQGLGDPDPYMYLQYIQKLLREQLATGTNDALQRLLEHHARDDEDKALEYLAQDIAERIEQVLLVRNPSSIADLMTVTGLSEADLLAPANVRGFWFLSVSSRVLNCTEVVDCVAALNYRIGEIMREYLSGLGNDSIVRMWHDNPWRRIEIHRPRAPDRMQIDVTRCQPDASGLRWIAASWRDDFFLEPGIYSHAYANADVVTDFSGKTVPGDPQRLRLVVTEHDGDFGKVLRRMVVKGEIDQMPESVKENFAKESLTRVLLVNWLTGGLRQALMPHLAMHPAPSWQVSTNGGVAVDIRLKARPGDYFAHLRYRIMLGEEIGPDTFSDVPVREKDLMALQRTIEGWLAAGDMPVDGTDPVPDFKAVF